MKIRQPLTNSKARIGSEISRARAALGMTQIELSARVGIGQGFLSRIEGGEKAPSVVLLTKLAGALDLDFAIGPETVIFPQPNP